jgi:hypothetical protein
MRGVNRKPWWHRGIESAVGWAAVALPPLLALGRATVGSAWCDDLPVVRGLGLVSVGASSSLSTAAMLAASQLPAGPLAFRAAVASALGLGLCTALLQRAARDVLERHVPGSALNAPLAAIAALTAGLGAALQREGTVGGGAVFGLAAGLGAVLAWSGGPRTLRAHLLAGAALGALASESPVAAAAVLVAIGASLPFARARLAPRHLLAALGAVLVVGTSLALPALLRPSAPHVFLDAGRSLTGSGLIAVDTAAQRTAAWAAWRDDVGWVSLGLAALGLLVGLVRARTRAALVPLAVLVACDVAFPASTGGVLAPDPLAGLRAMALSAVAIAAALGVQIAARSLLDTGLPMARAGAALLVMFDVTLVAVSAEQAAFALDRSGRRGAQVFADEGLAKLEPNAMVLVRSHAAMWRLLAERVTSGARPDVVVAPLPLVSRGSVATSLLAAEPAMALLLRDVSINGSPGEHAVARLADHRPLYVELDPAWDAKVAAHLVPDGIWLRLTPQPLGLSDRKLGLAASQPVLDRLADAARSGGERDPAAAAMLKARARQHALACAIVGDKRATRAALDWIAGFDPDDLFARDLGQRLDHTKAGPVDVRGLAR